VQSGAEQRSSQIIKNVLMNWVAFATTILIGFLMSPFLVRSLGDSVYGVWVLIGSLVGYLGLLDFGLVPSLVKYFAEYRARGDQEAINRLVTSGITVYSLVGLISLVVSLGVAFSFNDIFNSPLDRRTAAAVVVLAGVNLAISFPSSVFIGLVRGYQRYDIDARITSLVIFLRSGFVVYLVMKGYGILALSVLTLGFDLLRLVYLVRQAYRLNPEININRRHFDWPELRQLFGYSVFVFLIIIGKQMIFYTDSIVIGLFLTTSMVTSYFIASRLISYLIMLVSEMVGVLAPTTSDLDAHGDQAGIRELLIVSTKYMLLIALPVAAVFFVMGESFITLWMGPAYGESAALLVILTAAILGHLLLMPSETILLGLGKHRVIAWITLAQALTNLVLSLALVKPYGLRGVAWGTAVPMAVFAAAALVIYFRYLLGLPLGDYLRRSMPLPLVVQVPFVGLLVLLKTYSPPSSLVLFFLQMAAALVLYGVLAFFVCLSQAERRAFLRLAEKFGLKLSPRFI
jgi:O-antigen/teichoic acid export membrane protein